MRSQCPMRTQFTQCKHVPVEICFLPFEYTGKCSKAHLGHRVHLLHFELPGSLSKAHNSIRLQQKRWDPPEIVATGALQHKSQRWAGVLTLAIFWLFAHSPQQAADIAYGRPGTEKITSMGDVITMAWLYQQFPPLTLIPKLFYKLLLQPRNESHATQNLSSVICANIWP